MSTPVRRRLAAQQAAHSRWAKEDPKQGIAPARAGFMKRFETQVDPDGVLDPAERARRAESALRAYMAGLALKSAKARAAKKPRRSRPTAA